MKLRYTVTTADRGDRPSPRIISQRRTFTNSAAALRHADKMARKTAKKAGKAPTRENWGASAGHFPKSYRTAVVTCTAG